jgi:hypothetical protein
MAGSTTTDLQQLKQLQQLIQRDRQRKLMALLLLSGLAGAAIYVQAVWTLALLATGMAGAGALWRQRKHSAFPGSTPATEGGSQGTVARNHPLLPGTRGDQ